MSAEVDVILVPKQASFRRRSTRHSGAEASVILHKSTSSSRFRRQAAGKKGVALYERILEHRTVSIRALSKDWTEQMAYYRWLENASVTLSTLIESLKSHCREQVKGRHVLAISDTSEVNLHAHAGRLKPEGLGVVGNNKDIGFFIHPTLLVDSADGLPLGLSHVQVWTRPAERPSKEELDYKYQPIEEKE